MLIIAVPLGQVAKLPPSLMQALPADATVIDTGDYLPLRDGRIVTIEEELPETAWVAAQLGVPVVKTFNNITDYSLREGGSPKASRDCIAPPVSGDDPARRAAAMRLVESLGFDFYDAGPLGESWRQQIGQVAYCTDPTRAQLQRMLARADAGTVASKREGAMRIAAKLPDDFPKADLTQVARLMAGLDCAKLQAWRSPIRLAAAMRKRK